MTDDPDTGRYGPLESPYVRTFFVLALVVLAVTVCSLCMRVLAWLEVL
jgi:hypothetical protein